MHKCVLIVDDELNNRKLARDLLQILGVSTIEAMNGREGIDRALQDKPDLILMDIQMPLMDGIQAIQWLKSNTETQHIPIVVLTSCAMVGDEERVTLAGADHYLTKPIDTRQFMTLIKEILG